MILVLLGAGLLQAKGVDGTIRGGKAKKLVDKAVPLLKEAGELRKQLRIAEDTESDAYEADLKRCIALFDKGTLLLVDALEIQYDVAVNNMLLRASRELAKSRAALFMLENRRAWRAREKEKAERGEEPPKSEPEPEPESQPRSEPPPPKPPRFEASRPPAVPLDVAPRVEGAVYALGEKEWLRQNKKGIDRLVKEYYGARRKGKLRFRCKLCAGKGKFRGGEACGDCAGSGRQINLFYFRKVYWNAFTPLFRELEGALPGLNEFLAHARAHPDALADEVKSFKLVSIEPHALWARVTVQLKTAAGKKTESMSVVSIGSAWYFFQPATDEELIAPP